MGGQPRKGLITHNCVTRKCKELILLVPPFTNRGQEQLSKCFLLSSPCRQLWNAFHRPLRRFRRIEQCSWSQSWCILFWLSLLCVSLLQVLISPCPNVCLWGRIEASAPSGTVLRGRPKEGAWLWGAKLGIRCECCKEPRLIPHVNELVPPFELSTVSPLLTNPAKRGACSFPSFCKN